MNVRVKICGLTSVEQALATAAAGADAIGLNFHPASKRCVDPWIARQICSALPPYVTTVGLFVDRPADEVARIVAQSGIDMLQFQGDEQEAYCVSFGRPYIKAIRMREAFDVDAFRATWPSSRGVLLDAWHDELVGGTGETFDWSLAANARGCHVVLAGGLRPDNVGAAIRAVRPAAVDVCTGVERAPGDKDPQRVAAFVRAARQAGADG